MIYFFNPHHTIITVFNIKKIIFVLILLFTTFVHSQVSLKYNQVRNINSQISTMKSDLRTISKTFDKSDEKNDSVQLIRIYQVVGLRTNELESIYLLYDMVSKENRVYRDKFVPLTFKIINEGYLYDIEDLNSLIGYTNNYTIKKYSEDLKSEIRKIQSVMNQ